MSAMTTVGDEERMLRDTVRRWMADRLLPSIEEWSTPTRCRAS
jgi:hypothetical protein